MLHPCMLIYLGVCFKNVECLQTSDINGKFDNFPHSILHFLKSLLSRVKRLPSCLMRGLTWLTWLVVTLSLHKVSEEITNTPCTLKTTDVACKRVFDRFSINMFVVTITHVLANMSREMRTAFMNAIVSAPYHKPITYLLKDSSALEYLYSSKLSMPFSRILLYLEQEKASWCFSYLLP